MKDITHEEQQKIWDTEHTKPKVLLQMDSSEVASGVKKFWEFIKDDKVGSAKGLEMGCGKGRNVTWLSRQGIEMYGFDFSSAAITEAKKRATETGASNAYFEIQDATKTWKYDSDSFDFVIDCFASTDIEDVEGRKFAVQEIHRVLKKQGYLLLYVMSTDDEYHKMMIERSPAKEQNAFLHPDTGKFEKVFSDRELDEMYRQFKLIESRRIDKMTEFFGKFYYSKDHWRVYQKMK